MDAKTFLDEFLKVGQEYAQKGKAIVREKMQADSNKDPAEAQADNIKKKAIAAGALVLLLGTRGGRQLTGSALRVGGLAAIGGIAWQAWQNLKKQQAEKPAPKLLSVDQLEGEVAQERAIILIKAMLAAAKADGKLDDEERELINAQIQQLGLDKELEDIMKAGSVTPLSAKSVAKMADHEELAAEIYLVSALVTDRGNTREQRYMAELADALELPQSMRDELDGHSG